MDRSQLLQKLDTAWAQITESYAGLSESELTEGAVTGDWSVKDLLAHVTTWEEEALKYLPLILAGERPPRYSVTYGGIDAFNALMTERTRDLSLADVRGRFEETHRRLVAFIQGASPEQIFRDERFRRRLRLDAYGHYPLHTKQIHEWRARQSAG